MTRLAWVVFRKEMLNVLRDRKNLFVNIVLPILLWPVLALVIGSGALTLDSELAASIILDDTYQAAEVYRVALVGEVPPSLRYTLELDPGLDIRAVDTDSLNPDPALLSNWQNTPAGKAQRQQAEFLLQKHTLHAIVFMQAQADTTPLNHKLWLLYDTSIGTSTAARDYLDERLTVWRTEIMEGRLQAYQLDNSYIKPMPMYWENLRSPQHFNLVSQFAPMLPYILVMMLLVGCYPQAIDMLTGEKEAGTLPTLLCAPVLHMDLIIGKYLAITLMGWLTASANLLSIALVVIIATANLELDNILPFSTLGLLFGILVPLAFLYAALSMLVVMFANTTKEAQMLMPLLMIVALLLAFVPFSDVKLTPFTALLPAVNANLLIEQILKEPVHHFLILLIVVSNALLAALVLFWCSRLFANETILFSTTEGLFNALFSQGRSACPVPQPGLAMLAFMVVVVALFYLSLLLANFDFALQLTVIQLLLFLSVPLLLGKYFRWPIATSFRFTRPSLRALVAALLLGGCGWLALSWSQQIVPMPEDYAQQLNDALGFSETSYTLLFHLFLVALLPGVCEEVFFRGLLLSAFLQRFSAFWAIVLSALCFGLVHLSIYRFFPTFFLGLVLGYLVWRSGSIWPGMLMHGINNATAVWLSRQPVVDADLQAELPPGLLAAAVLACGVGLWLLQRDAAARRMSAVAGLPNTR